MAKARPPTSETVDASSSRASSCAVPQSNHNWYPAWSRR
jgi:hypothetical protein